MEVCRSYRVLIVILLALWIFLIFKPAHASLYYSINDLGECFPLSINNLGQVVGWVWTGWGYTPFIWTREGGMTNIGTFGEENAVAVSINNLRQVLVTAFSYNGTPNVSESRVFLWTVDQGEIRLGTASDGPYYGAQAMNDLGQVVGYHTNISLYGTPFFWAEDKGVIEIETLGGEYASVAMDINNSGEVVGHSSKMGGGHGAFLWTLDNGITDLGTLGGMYSEAAAINNLRQVVGFSEVTPHLDDHEGFLWSVDTGMISLGTFYPWDINAASQIVGHEISAGASLWENGAIYPLYDFIVNGFNWEYLFHATGINDAGQIIGWGKLRDVVDEEGNVIAEGEYHGFLASPLVSPLASPIVLVNIDIKPWRDSNRVNFKSKGKIPVAILSNHEFDATEVDPDSLTFGRTGNEQSLAFCNPRPGKVNRDRLKDLICHFYTEDTGFQCGDTLGVLKGKTTDGTPIAGRDSVRIVPCK